MGSDGEAGDGRVARLASQRARTAALISDLRDELAALAETTAAGPDDEHDAEGSTVAYERARVRALLAHTERTAAAIDVAAARAAGTTDGVLCRECRSAIPDERRIAIPTTEVCVICASAQ